MASSAFTTPVVLIIFNRPDTTAQVLAAIRAARPTRLFVIADGPRAERATDARQCAAARALVERLDWPCEVIRNFSDTNLGCRRRVASGLDWVFDQVEQAVILEDDCVPHLTFFRYCEELLERWRNDQRVCAIAGDNFQAGRRRTAHSYYFSRYSHVWGWATWRRAWQYYDDAMQLWPEARAMGWLADVFHSPRMITYWTERFQSTYEDRVDSWAMRWTLSCWLQNGLTALPNVNLVSNIGHGPQGTHTTAIGPLANLPTQAMSFPLDHPRHMLRDTQADAFTDAHVFAQPSRVARWWRRAHALARRLGRAVP